SGADLSGADLSGADLSGADLSGAILDWADLTGANLTGADLTNANLTNAYLSWAELDGADLSGANLTYADLSNANLKEGANLTNAILAWADLTGANLTGANLTGANLTGAYLTDANLTNADLTNADLTMAIVNDFTLISSPSGWTIENGMMVATTVKNAYAIQIDANTNIALDSTVGGVGGLWSWYSNGVASDPSNSLSVFLASVRNATMHRMSHSAFDPGSLSQTSGSTTYDYNYTGIPGSGNNDSTKGVVLKYTATEEREILIETTGGAWNDAVIVIFTEAHLNGGSAPFRVVTADAGDPETFKVKFPYFTDNQDGNIYYIALTSNRSSDLASDTPLRITASDITAPVITSGTTGTDLAENSGAGQTVYTIAASDANGVVSYAIGGTDAASLTVNPTIGVVTLNTNPDYEAKNSYSFTVTASDAAGNTSDPTTVTFQITDIDEIPLVIEPGANLAGADLSGADLYGANLSGADLSNANLSDANLYGAALSDANLNGANLNNASLYGANLSNANLAGADLSGANLYGALLSNANLSNANLNGANLYGAVLSDANLTNATVNDVTEISLPGRWIIENNMIVEVEVEPVLVSELPDITATEDGPDVLIDLGPFFKDDNSADDAAMSYAVTENTNGAMVTTSVNTDVFVLKGSYRNGGGYAGEVVVDGNYAYVADGQQGLTVVNVSDPESPTLAGNYDPGWDIGDVAISGGYAYLANQSGGVRVVSIADPSNPTEVAQYITAGSARGIDVSGNYAYVADGSGLVILDVSNPSAPVLVGTSNTPDFAYRVDVEGGHAYVADRAGGLQIVDISDPSSPQIVGSYSTQAGSNWSTGAAWGVKVEGGYAYMAASGAGLIIVDVSNPANPVLEGSYSTNVGDARGVYVLSGKAYLADGSSGSSGLLVIDVTSPSSPVLVGTYDSMGSGMGVTAVGDYAYLADWGGGLKIVDTTYITDELALSFEPDASGSADITVTATSGADTVSDTFNVTIANVNDAPQFNNGSGGPFGDEWQFTIGEDASVDAVVGTVTATDVDGDTLDYSITDGNEFGLFTIDPSSGEIKVWGVLDYETATYHSLKVQVADTALSATTWVRVDVSNVPEITLAGDAVVTIEVGGSYTEDSATSDGGETVAATGTVNTNTVDTYTITYSATDNFNNTGTAIRTVNVVDITKPVISLTGDAVVTIEAGTPYQDQGVTVSDNYDTNLTVTIDSSDVNTSVLGSYEVIYSATDGSGNVADEETRTVIVEDNTAPVITLIGDAQVTIEMGGTYTEQGATFLDNHDTELTTTIEDDVDTAVVGSYEVIYSATDDFENKETATRTVIVEDTTAPDAPTLNGPALTKSTTPTLIGTAEPGSIVRIYHDGSELGSATAESGSYSITVSSLSSLSEGSHIITATATDAFNNVSAGTTHEVEVDTTAPVISVTPGNDIGAANITVTAPMIIWTAGEPHAQINFNSSSTADQTALASALGFESFDQTEIINYMFNNDIEMTVLHDDGNSFTFKIVPGQDQSFADGYVYLDPRPVTSHLQGDFEITVKLSSPMVEAGAPYSDAGATADGEESVVTTGTVDTSVLGPHTLTYTAEDLAGNVGTATRTVTVVDTTLPEITLIGGEVTIEVDGSYTELGATLLDNYDSSSSLGSSDLYVIDSSAVNTSVVGEYTVNYNVTDSEDNVAQQVTRTVNVVDTTLPEITLNGGDVTIEVGAPYEEPGATVSDNYDTDLNAEIDSDAVNTSDVGSYSV
ncbi:pentapeptide repeat-containing protein, partial [Akkermansiaceae bacterium]|nr:pentapeptide repeat-containing protein [Akkermansiaceae bacterium]